MSQISIEGVSKRYADVTVLKNINLEIEDGSFTVLLGPSGCGKTTLLRSIAGLVQHGEGQIWLDDQNVTRQDPGMRNLAMVFQNYALYPHLNVLQNIEYGLKARKVPKEERELLIDEAVEMVQLGDQIKKRPSQMSGGQRQRVALARAIVKRPKVFLMDEPLSNLDAKLRAQMRVELTELYQKLQTTFLYVTHDQVEAMSMGNSIVIMNEGEVLQQGTPQEIYEAPANVFVASFIGSPPANIIDKGDFKYGIRPEHIAFTAEAAKTIEIAGKALSCEHLGSETIFNVATEYGPMRVKTPNMWNSELGDVRLCIDPKDMFCFDASGARIYEADARIALDVFARSSDPKLEAAMA